MHELILWAGFLGAWLLVAGPIYQATIELRAEEFERERMLPTVEAVAPPATVSSWWWLVPPVRLWLSQRSRDDWQRRLLIAMPDEDYEALNSFMAKARGWMFVGAGGLLILSKETWELVEGHEWDAWVFWVLFIVMTLLAAGNAAALAGRERRQTEERRASRAQAAGPQ